MNRFSIVLLLLGCSLLSGCFTTKTENSFPIYNMGEVKYSQTSLKKHRERQSKTPKEYYDCWKNYRSEFPILCRASCGVNDYFSKLDFVKPLLNTSDENAIKLMKKSCGDFQLPATVTMSKKDLFQHIYFQKDIYSVRLGKFQFARASWHIDALKMLYLVYGGSPELKQQIRDKYAAIVNYALGNIKKLSDEQLAAKINEKGTLDPMNRVMREAACLYAGLYQVTGDENDARRAVIIIERFAEVLKHWQLHSAQYVRGNFVLDKNGNKKTHSIPVDKPLTYEKMKSTSRHGIWGIWGRFYDLNSMVPLAQAYFEVKNSASYDALSSQEKQRIVDDLFITVINQHFHLPFANHNQSPCRFYRAIQLGLAFQQPDWIHWAVNHIHMIQHTAFFRDGMWHEGTQHYAQEFIGGLKKSFILLKGYSDPAGYVNKQTGKRLDNVDPLVEFGYNLNLEKDAIIKTLLPDGRFMAFEDTHWFHIRPRYMPDYLKKPPTQSDPFLLGGSKIGMMGFGKGKDQVRLYLHFEGTNSHDHMDNPGITLWAANEEIMSETGYYGAGKFARDTSAHNLVMVDEKPQPRYCRRQANWLFEFEGKPIPGYPGCKFGDWESQGMLKNTDGKLTLWDTTNEMIQVAEVDSKLAYNKHTVKGGMTEYRRTLTLVRVNEKQFYILDIFRLRGGKVYDWMEHGNLAKKYSVQLLDMNNTPIAMQKAGGKLGKFLEITEKGKTNDAFQMIFDSGSPAKLRTVFAKVANTEILRTAGHPIRTHKRKSGRSRAPYKLDYMSVRRTGPQQVYIAVHEVFTDKPLVSGINSLKVNSKDDQAVAVEIKLADGRRDIIMSSAQNQSMTVPQYDIQFTGKLGAIANLDKPTVTLFASDSFKWKDVNHKQPPLLNGHVLEVRSKDQGDSENAFIVSGSIPSYCQLAGKTLFLIDAMDMAHSYTISKITPLPNNQTKISVTRETGLKKDENGFHMTYYPCRPLPGKLRWLINSSKVLKD